MAANQEEVMRLVAEVVDKFSGPIRDMGRALDALGATAGNVHKTGTQQVRDQAKAYGGLDQSVRTIADRTKSMLIPALGAVGVTILSVASAVDAIVKSTTDFANSTSALARLSQQTGVTIQRYRELDEYAKRVGSSPEAMNAGIQALAHNLEELHRWMGPLAEWFQQQQNPALRDWGANVLRNASSVSQAIDLILQLDDHIADSQQKMNMLRAMGLPTELGINSYAEFKRIMGEIRQDLGKLPEDSTRVGQALNVAILRMQTAMLGTRNIIGYELADPFTKALDAMRDWIEEERGPLASALHDLGEEIVGLDWSGFGKGLADTIKNTVNDVHLLIKALEAVKAYIDFTRADWQAWAHPTAENNPATEAQKSLAAKSERDLHPWDWKGAPGRAWGRLRAPGALFGPPAETPPATTPTMPPATAPAAPSASGPTSPGSLLPINFDNNAIRLPVKSGTEEGTRKGVFDGLRDWFEYASKGGAGGFQNAAYTPSGEGTPGGGGGAPSAPAGGAMPFHSGGGYAMGAPDEAEGPGTGAARAGAKGPRTASLGPPGTGEMSTTPTLSGSNNPLAPINIGGRLPASIRYNNPGASWPSRTAKQFGGIGYGMISGNNRIEGFPTADEGIADNMAELRDYVRRGFNTVGRAESRWSAGGRLSLPGYPANTVITPEMLNDPNFMITFERMVANAEAGRKSPITAEQLMHGFTMYQAGHTDRGEAQRGGQKPGGLAAAAPVPYLDLLQTSRRTGFGGAAPQKVEGNASLNIDLNGFPKGTRAKTEFGGLFKDVQINRGRSMPMASEDQ